jgi:hypothetical protein
MPAKVPVPLLHHDVGHVQAARHHQYDDHRKADGQFVRHHLGRRAHRARNAYFELDAQPAMITP